MSHTAHWAVAATVDQLQETKLVLGDFWSRSREERRGRAEDRAPHRILPAAASVTELASNTAGAVILDLPVR